MANDKCIKWSWDFNGHLSLAVKVYRKLLGAAAAAVCLPNGQLSAHSLSVSPKFLFWLCSLHPVEQHTHLTRQNICVIARVGLFFFFFYSLFVFLSKPFQQTCRSLFRRTTTCGEAQCLLIVIKLIKPINPPFCSCQGLSDSASATCR